MTDDDFKYLRERVDSIHEIVSKGAAKNEEQDRRLDSHSAQIEPIKTDMNKVKGAIALIVFLVGALGTLHFLIPPAAASKQQQTSEGLRGR